MPNQVKPGFAKVKRPKLPPSAWLSGSGQHRDNGQRSI
jgi:hypothetical protein